LIFVIVIIFQLHIHNSTHPLARPRAPRDFQKIIPQSFPSSTHFRMQHKKTPVRKMSRSLPLINSASLFAAAECARPFQKVEKEKERMPDTS
jgi:hypothetical protein